MTSSPGTLECADARPEPAACARKLRDGACGLKLWGCDRTCGLCEYSACIQSANITWTVSTLGNRSDFITLLQRALSQTRYTLRVMPAINGYDRRATMQALLSTGTSFHKLCGKVSDEDVENNLYRWGGVASFVTRVQRIQDQVREGWPYAFHIEDDARIHQWHVLRMVKSLCAHYCGGNFRDDCSRCLRICPVSPNSSNQAQPLWRQLQTSHCGRIQAKQTFGNHGAWRGSADLHRCHPICSAILSRRARGSGAATAALLMERQLLEAKLRAAEQHLERAAQAVRLAKAALPGAHADKRQRGESPAWVEREYASYDTVEYEYWRQEEGRIYNRRRDELSAG